MATQLFTSFTSRYSGKSNILENKVTVLPTGNSKDGQECSAIWDTGATNSVITKETAKILKLVPTGMANVRGVHSTERVYTYLVDLILPNKLTIKGVRVTECKELVSDSGLLIGMDIITQGDFAVSNFNNKTTFTFRYPSLKETDYNEEGKRFNKKSTKSQPNYTPPKKKRKKGSKKR